MKINRLATWILSLAIVCVASSDLLAQRGGDGGGGRGGFGGGPPGGFGGGRPGGFGGGMPGFGGGGASSMQLLAMDEVRKELELNEAQLKSLKKVGEELGKLRSDERPERMNFRSMSEDERREAFEKMRKQGEEMQAKMETETKDRLEEILDFDQQDRLQELRIQRMGLMALMNDDVASKLEITATQKEKLQELGGGIREQIMEKVREMRESDDFDFSKMTSVAADVMKETETKAMEVLTADQRTKFKEMKGEEFEFPEPQFGGRSGFGRGGFGRGGDRGGRGGDRGGDRQRRQGGDRGEN